MLSSDEDRLRLECVSNSSQPVNGSITTPSGLTLHPDLFYGIWILNKPFNRPGVFRFRNREGRPLTTNEMGVYTCMIPDDNGNIISLNVGLYPNNFTSEAVCCDIIRTYCFLFYLSEPPQITNLAYHKETRSLSCISSVSPATRVVWMRDGVPLTTDGSSHYSLSQTVSHRSTSTYHNVLMIRHTAPGVAGNYTCTVSNDLGSHSMSVVAIGKFKL